ncbi:hypothetical protein BKA58DRAFT_424733 [Alternaria rosae]|uniref:uncharacterized protein n=1 Tax=Alternaria rosae TaxID=1187941 RepID=UPI001E8D5ED5|nr:uncharacterized protein BKA58DRAFT_424733 [Alternaria rosae]KAH6857480.1 hypothetical protein BKA58DRAFT_424733 [Alternaria rosae]
MPRIWPAVALLAATAVSNAMLRSARLFLAEQALCRRYYAIHNPAIVAPDGRVDEQQCKLNVIQAELSMVIGVFEALTLLGGILGTPLTMRLAPSIGLRKTIAINVFMMCCTAFYSTIVTLLPEVFNVRMIWLTGFFELVSGGAPARNALMYIHLAERVSPDALSGNLYRLSTLLMVMSFIGTSLGAILLATDQWLLCFLGVSFCVLGFLFVPLLQERSWKAALPPSTLVASPYMPLMQCAGAGSTASDTVKSEPPRTWMRSLKMVLRTTRAEGYQSSQILVDLLQDRVTLLSLLIYFCYETAIYIRAVLPQWASKSFAWTLAEVNAVTALQILINGGVLLSLPYLSKLFLLPRLSSQRMVDHWTIQTSLICNIIGLIMVSIAPTRRLYIVALGVYNLGAALSDSLRSFVTASLRDEKQVKKMYTAISMVEAMAGLAGTTLWSTTFAAGMQYGGIPLARACLFAAASLFVLSLLMTTTLNTITSEKSRRSIGGSEV